MLKKERMEEICAEHGLSGDEAQAFINDVIIPLNESFDDAYAYFGSLLIPKEELRIMILGGEI